jgi:hypothetical protein
MTLIGADLNSTRLRAVHDPVPGPLVPLALEDGQPEFALAVSFDGRSPEVGRVAAAMARTLPHLVCADFLPHLGGERTWNAGRHRLDASRALALVCEAVAPRFAKTLGLAVSLPAYFDSRQRSILDKLVAKARWRVLATTTAPLAAALAAGETLPRAGLALVGDVDGHAFTWSALALRDDRAALLETSTLPGLGRATWLRLLVDGVAQRCVRTTRRDPRESAEAEQGLYDQLGHRLSALPESSRAELAIQTKQWFQNLLLEADELRAWCAPLATQAAAAMQDMRALAGEHGPMAAVLLTGTAGRLPGLVAALEDHLHPPVVLRPNDPGGDFGDGLLFDESETDGRVHVLDPDALARAAHELAGRVARGEIESGHYEEVVLAAGTDSDESGPARLHFRGRDHLLSEGVFTLGRDPACDLVFESELYPSVSARHCEIVLDRRIYLLRDRSRHGTLVNDCPVMQQTSLRPGDWIRLGPSGPLLRFLGQPGDPRTVVTA